MTENNTNSEEEQERQEQEINSDMEAINPKVITPLDVVKDAFSTMKREEILEPYDSAKNSNKNPDNEQVENKLIELAGLNQLAELGGVNIKSNKSLHNTPRNASALS